MEIFLVGVVLDDVVDSSDSTDQVALTPAKRGLDFVP